MSRRSKPNRWKVVLVNAAMPGFASGFFGDYFAGKSQFPLPNGVNFEVPVQLVQTGVELQKLAPPANKTSLLLIVEPHQFPGVEQTDVFGLLAELLATQPFQGRARLCVSTAVVEVTHAVKAWLAGARAFYYLGQPLEGLAPALERLLVSNEPLDDDPMFTFWRKLVAEPCRKFPHKDLQKPLTRRQIQLVRLLASGLSNAGIAQAMGVTVNTVKEMVGLVLANGDFESRTAIAVWANQQSGLMPRFGSDFPVLVGPV